MSDLRADESLRLNREMVIRRIVARAPFCEDLCPANLFRCGRELHLPEEVTVVAGQFEKAISANEVLKAIESGRCSTDHRGTIVRSGSRNYHICDSRGWDDIFQAAFAWQKRNERKEEHSNSQATTFDHAMAVAT